jgi:hypothetical protein
MESTPLQVTYRAIFTQMLLAQSAAIGAFADVAARCALLAGQQYQQESLRAARKIRSKGDAVEPTHPGGRLEVPELSLPTFANSARAYAAMPRISMMVFLSRYDKLRDRRGWVQD